MYPVPGHLSVSYLIAHYLRLDLRMCILAGIMPDIIDKLLTYVFETIPYGRSFMHSITGVAIATTFCLAIGGRHRGIAWLVSHFAHLVSDYIGTLLSFNPAHKPFIPWLFPFRTYVFPSNKWTFQPILLLVESILMLIAVMIIFKERALPVTNPKEMKLAKKDRKKI